MTMGAGLSTLLERVPDSGRDVRLNVASLLERSSLAPETARTLALACALALRHPALADALRADANLPPERIAAAETAAGLMAMNNVYYRFRHLSAVPEYAATPAGLRMSALARPGIPKPEFELLCLAISALNGCESCIRSHDKAVRDAGLTATNVLDAVRIGSALAGLAVLA